MIHAGRTQATPVRGSVTGGDSVVKGETVGTGWVWVGSVCDPHSGSPCSRWSTVTHTAHRAELGRVRALRGTRLSWGLRSQSRPGGSTQAGENHCAGPGA